ncbi:aromatic ring-hydroxylating dioxygenase subunit alpha [Polaromonas sp.]|uniref:aromatic ring-hydroxylating dioxygenase subunit alpha n=1 Tax=Polaromonas sp. TaxID=1869339 RepID=UPI00326706E5
MWLKNCWYVAAWDHELLGDTLLPRTILEQSILLYRKSDGIPIAIDNRCAHRGAPLSMGRREGDAIRCMYHGLKFEANGRCSEIPGQPAIPAKMCVRTYPVIEQDRWIWIWMGDPALADSALIPPTPTLKHPEWKYRPGYMHYQADYQLICDNLLDFSHLSYVHEKTLGGSPNIAEVAPSIERIPRGLQVSRDVRNTLPAPYHRRLGQFGGKVHRKFRYEFMLPAILLLHAQVKPVETAEDDMTGALQFDSCQALTPETASSTHYFYMQAHKFRQDDATITESIYQSLCTAFEEDRRIIEAQQKMLNLSNQAPMQMILADKGLAIFRRMLNEMYEEEKAAATVA